MMRQPYHLWWQLSNHVMEPKDTRKVCKQRYPLDNGGIIIQGTFFAKEVQDFLLVGGLSYGYSKKLAFPDFY